MAQKRYIQLKNELVKIIHDQNLQPHDRFLSQPTVIKEYNVTITTVRKTFDEMEREGLIYRIHGKGTFIAPKSNTYTILIVSNYNLQAGERHISYMAYWAGIQDYLDNHDLNYYPISINNQKFLSIRDDLQVYYRNLKGVIFFRDCDSYLESMDTLRAANIPCFFYGSDYYKDRIQTDYLFYNEKRIVEIAIDKILEQGYKNIGIYYHINNPVRVRRYNWFLEILSDKNIDSIVCQKKVTEETLVEIIRGIGKRIAFFCVDDWLAAELMNCSILAGKSIPEDIGIIGVNNYPFCSVMIKPLTSVDIPLFDDAKICFSNIIEQIEGQKDLESKYESKIEIVNRSSL